MEFLIVLFLLNYLFTVTTSVPTTRGRFGGDERDDIFSRSVEQEAREDELSG